jgi:hypothetical protein
VINEISKSKSKAESHLLLLGKKENRLMINIGDKNSGKRTLLSSLKQKLIGNVPPQSTIKLSCLYK